MLDDIKTTFACVKDLADRLSKTEPKPLVFEFLEMKDLGMEDSLYIKLNARGKPLTALENFKARLTGRMKKLNVPFSRDFELHFDKEWTDLFCTHDLENFDLAFLTFFGVLMMNENMAVNDFNWADSFDFDKVDLKVIETIYYTLNFWLNTRNAKMRRI